MYLLQHAGEIEQLLTLLVCSVTSDQVANITHSTRRASGPTFQNKIPKPIRLFNY